MTAHSEPSSSGCERARDTLSFVHTILQYTSLSHRPRFCDVQSAVVHVRACRGCQGSFEKFLCPFVKMRSCDPRISPSFFEMHKKLHHLLGIPYVEESHTLHKEKQSK